MVLAQAILERGLLGNVVNAASNAMTSAGYMIQRRPWIVLVVAAVVALFIFTRRH